MFCVVCARCPQSTALEQQSERPIWLVDIMVAGMNTVDAEFAQAQNRYVPTFAVLFTQGINEMQVFANRLGQASNHAILSHMTHCFAGGVLAASACLCLAGALVCFCSHDVSLFLFYLGFCGVLWLWKKY